LWQIARHYSVSVKQLQRWNDLQGGRIRPGQRLKVSPITH
jgi:LysM domain.